MSSFTHFIRALDADPAQPDPEAFREVWEALRKALVHELRRRGLWRAPPSYLGVYGRTAWSDGDALEELLADCYEFIFIDRQRGLRAELKVKDDVDGLVFRIVDHFLYELQKRHDPLGFRVFSSLRTAVRSAIAGGRLYLLDGNPRVGNDSLLGFSPEPAAEAGVNGFEDRVSVWSDHLMPELVTADGRARKNVLRSLEDHLCHLRDHGVDSFRFRAVVDPLKTSVRRRWSLLWDLTEGESALTSDDRDAPTRVRLVGPDLGFEERDAFDDLVAKVTAAIDRLDESERARNDLHRLWAFVRHHAEDRSTGGTPGSGSRRDDLPSQRKLAKTLAISRDRLPALFETLRRLVARCREAGPPHRAAIGRPASREVALR